MKKKIKRLLIWLSIYLVIFTGFLGLNLPTAQAKKSTPSVETTVSFARASAQGPENVALPTVKVTLFPQVSAADTSVDYQVIGGTAIAGIDYEMVDGTAEIKAGKITVDLPLKIIDDPIFEKNKTIVISLSGAQGATLAEPKVFTYTILDDETLPATVLETNPALANGQNGWFIKERPQITFSTDRIAITYYQWNKTHGTWQEYQDTPILALEGKNTLYYYSVDTFGNTVDTFGNTEAIKSGIIKVDTKAPSWPHQKKITAITDNDGHVELSWSRVSGVTYFEVWRKSSPYKLIAKVDGNSYEDKTVKAGQNYIYKVIAVDQAGNKSEGIKVSILIPEIKKIESASQVTPAPTVSVSPAVGGSISQAAPQKSVQAAAQEEPKAVEVAKQEETQKTTESKNWNRLLLAISILIIAAGAAIGGYYGYEWWMARREEPFKDDKPSSKSRW